MYEIPFAQEVFRPTFSVPHNDTTDQPVEFELSTAGGPDLARLRSVVHAAAGLTVDREWSPAVQRSVVEAFRTGNQLFANTVDAVRHLTVPAALAKRAGLIQDLPKSGPKTPIPITTGAEFAAVAGFRPLLALEVAMRISKMTEEEQIDARFFDSPSTSSGTAPDGPSGSASAATPGPGAAGTAGSPA